jgi:hypothetical protein
MLVTFHLTETDQITPHQTACLPFSSLLTRLITSLFITGTARWFPKWRDGFFQKRMIAFVDDWAHGGEWVKYTPKGLAFTGDWGSLRHVGNGIFLLQAYAKRISDPALKAKVDCLTLQQLNYILGSTGKSYVVGYGENSPQQAHHRAASCPPLNVACTWDAMNNPGSNPHVLYGALVGGPDGSDGFKDNRNNFIQNEVAVDYNGGFTGALAAMLDNQRPASEACPAFPLPKGAPMALEKSASSTRQKRSKRSKPS